jgi:nucleoside-diphosphate-sugar epimerase
LGDITDSYGVKNVIVGKDIVFHLAALIGIPYSYTAPESYVATNIRGTLNVIQASLDSGVERVIHTSTSEVYGTALYTPIDEKHPLQGQSPYSASKIGADKIAESYFCSFKTLSERLEKILVPYQQSDNSLIISAIGWTPHIELEKSLNDMLVTQRALDPKIIPLMADFL